MEELRRIAEPKNENARQPRPKVALEHSPGRNAASFPEKISRALQSFFASSSSKSPPSPDAGTPPVEPFVILPLYIYPDPGAWDIFYRNITDNPSLGFYIIINPNSGPGSGFIPDDEYIAGISQLNSYANTQLYGYVHTLEASRPQSAMQADINKYAGWASYTAADIHMDGIFFDEAPSIYTKSKYSTMQTITSYVKRTMGLGFSQVVYNPGVVPDIRYYALADIINAYEDHYYKWSPKSYLKVPAQYRGRSTMMIHGFTGSLRDQHAVVRNMLVEGGWRGLYINDQADYNELSRSWAQFCTFMTAR